MVLITVIWEAHAGSRKQAEKININCDLISNLFPLFTRYSLRPFFILSCLQINTLFIPGAIIKGGDRSNFFRSGFMKDLTLRE